MRDDFSAPAEKEAVSVDTDQARQAVTGHGVRYVLAFGIAGVVLAFIFVLAYWR